MIRDPRRAWRMTVASIVTLGGCIVGCNGTSTPRPPSPGPPPETVSVAGGDTTVGFFGGARREGVSVASFRVTRYPVTVGAYRACVSAGACTPPAGTCGGAGSILDRPTFGDAAASDQPLTCASADQAKAFCGWTGGHLPRAAEWLLAARGPMVQAHAWGAADTSCARHPVASGILADARSCCEGREGCTLADLARVGTHPEGASPSGVEDVLVARGELVASDDRAAVTRCGDGNATCIVVGYGGAIEGLVAWQAADATSTTFRCAYEESSR